MSFHSGRVSFCRFLVEGDLPTREPQALLDKLAANAFTDRPVGAPDEIESGWVAGEHLFDQQFSYEKNGYGDVLLFALRIDVSRVPAAIKQAYRRMHEQALAAGNPSGGSGGPPGAGAGGGFLSRAQKKDAKDSVDQQIHEDLASGKYRRSKLVPVLWDVPRGEVYCAAAGNTVTEQLLANFRQTFELSLSPLTAGGVASRVLRGGGKSREHEDLRPSAFTPPPAEAREDREDAAGARDVAIPPVPWTAGAVEVKDFVGNEFLIWLWWLTETAEGMVKAERPGGGGTVDLAIVIDRALDMDCAWGVRGKQTLRGGGPTRLAEAGAALRHGKWPRKAGLILADGEHQWELTLQADRWVVSAALLPEAPEAESPRELVEQRLLLTRGLAGTLDALFAAFLKVRTGKGWDNTRGAMREWIRTRKVK